MIEVTLNDEEVEMIKRALNSRIRYHRITPTPQTAKWIADNIPIKSFGVYKQVADKISGGKSKSKQSMVKKVCPCCGNIARVTSEYKLISSADKLSSLNFELCKYHRMTNFSNNRIVIIALKM